MKNQFLKATVSVLAFSMFMMTAPLMAQSEGSSYKSEYVFKTKTYPSGFDSYYMASYFFDDANAYTLRSFPICEVDGTIKSLKINPSGSSYAILSQKRGVNKIAVYDFHGVDEVIKSYKKLINPSAIAYTPDARNFLISAENQILVYDARTYEPIVSIPTAFTANYMAVSPNSYFLAASACDSSLSVWNYENKNLRTTLQKDSKVNAFSFSDDSKSMAVVTADGVLSIYDTQHFTLQGTYGDLGEAKHCDFHPSGKYVSVLTSQDSIVIVNLLDNNDRLSLTNENGGITETIFIEGADNQVFLVYNNYLSIVYKLMTSLVPYYKQLLSDQVDKNMAEWMKQMPNESMEAYALRVNDESREKQMRLFEQEISTQLAEDMVQMSEVSLGSYSTESNMLAVNFDNMPSIYLAVPNEEVTDFMDPGNLEFRNAKYGLTEDDKFELIYAEVYNKSTGKSYTYDNTERREVEFLVSEEEFVPLELVQQTNMQEVMLQEIKMAVIETAKERNVISDHTNIAVNTDIKTDVDAEGNNIRNYNIELSYEVEVGFSAQEDFAPGKYKVEDSGAAMSMLAIMKEAFEGEFSKYVKEGKKLVLHITGMADSMPIHGKIAYDGSYGELEKEPVYKGNELSNITLTKKGGITQNEQLAMLRALGVGQYITNNIKGVSDMDVDYQYHIELSKGKGGEFRRISVSMTFVDAL